MTGLRILVVDDEPLIRWSLREALGELGFAVSVAEDGRAAVRALAEAGRPPDVVLLDYLLPDSNGLALFATIRDLVPDSKLILMTAYGTPDVVRCALELGAYRVISKPFEVDAITSIISDAPGCPA